jgi:hypothetical protein
MAFVSLQGTSLTRSQRERLQQQQALKSSFLNPVLAQSVADTIKELEVRKQQGFKPEKIWFPDRQETGTISIAEWMGF